MKAAKTTFMLAYTPSIPRRYAEIVSGLSGHSIAPYEHSVFSCGERFSKPTKSLRGKGVVVLSTFHPQTANEDAMRLLIMLDGLRRMDIKGIDFVGLHFPRFLDLASLYTGIGSLAVVDLPYSKPYLQKDAKFHIGRPAIDLMQEGLARSFSIRMFNISTSPLFASHFKELASNLLLSSIETYDMVKDILRIFYPEALPSWPQGRTSIKYQYSKSGRKMVGAELKGESVQGRTVGVADYQLTSGEKVKRALEVLGNRGATAVHVAVTHATFSGEIQKELENPLVQTIATTDTLGVPGESWIKKGEVVEKEFLSFPLKFQVLSTAEIVAKALKSLEQPGAL